LESDLSFLTKSQVELIKQFPGPSFYRQDRAHQEKFLKFWQLLSRLIPVSKVLGYFGFGLLRDVCIGKFAASLNILSRPEKHIISLDLMRSLELRKGWLNTTFSLFGAKIYSGCDAYYFEDKVQEAGLFFETIRRTRYSADFSVEIPTQIADRAKAKIKNLCDNPFENHQAICGFLSGDKSQRVKPDETVVNFAWRADAFPVLHTLPDKVDKVNVNMGYPVKKVPPVYSFLEAVLGNCKLFQNQSGRWQVLFLPYGGQKICWAPSI